MINTSLEGSFYSNLTCYFALPFLQFCIQRGFSETLLTVLRYSYQS